ncbi:MAG: T9SS type A sorting domain-containing protein [Saprospiraceae bacterium]|nr:T9SS type A sorting domain-containing protein [Saprospiraceae bacterium]
MQIGRVESQGDSQLPQNYSFEDVPPFGKWSYRLKQVDWDGQFSYSPIRNIELNNAQLKVCLAGSELKINTPNPLPIRIYDTIGRLIWQGQVQASLDLSHFSKGMFVYFIGDDTSYQCGKLLLK